MFPGFATMNSLRRLARPARPPRQLTTQQPDNDSESECEDEAPSASFGHAVDVLQLWSTSWFGSGPKAKSHGRTGAGLQPKQSASSSPALKPVEPPGATRLPAICPPDSSQQPVQDSAKTSDATEPAGRTVQPSAPVPTSSAKQPLPQQQAGQEEGELPPEALAVQQLPGIGTWAGRQRLFARPADLRGIPRTPSGGSAQLHPAPSPSGAGGAGLPGTPSGGGAGAGVAEEEEGGSIPAALSKASSSVRSEQAREAAWRWRFTRKWEAEQKKYYEEGGVEGASLVSNDDLDAIRYTQACGMGENLQFDPPLTRTASRLSNGLHTSLSACQFDVSGHGGSGALGALALATEDGQDLQLRMSLDASQQPLRPRGGGGSARAGGGAPWLTPAGEAAQPSATDAVFSMVTKARDLLQKQRQIEQEAQSRWERSLCGGSDEAWAGQRLEQVQIGMSGRFRYVVLRALDARGHQRYLVRGRSRAAPAELADEVAAQAAAVCRRESLPPLVVEVVGGGVMEWREDTDRHLHLSAAPPSGDSISAAAGSGAAGGGGFSPKKGPALGDVTGLAASLVRQALPCHFQVTTTSAPSRTAALMETLHI